MAAANRRGCGNRRGCAAVAVAPVSAMVLMERRGPTATTALPCIIWRNRDRRVQGLHQRGVSNQRVRACARTVGECARASVCMARARSRGLKLGRGGGGGAHMRGLVLHLSTWRQSGHVLRPQCCERERESPRSRCHVTGALHAAHASSADDCPQLGAGVHMRRCRRRRTVVYGSAGLALLPRDMQLALAVTAAAA